RYIEVEGRLRRMMAVVKIRASAHSTDLRLFHIDDEGVKIGQRLAGYEGLLSGSPNPTQSIGQPLHGTADG
ncbi:MAG: hypothetical protein ABI128_09665, partial [Rhodanobacter sp.]